MVERFRLAIAQVNPTVGALFANAAKAVELHKIARSGGADMIAFPEMYISGYPVQDLVLKPAFVADCMSSVEALARDCADGPTVGVGAPILEDGKLYNAYCVLSGGKIVAQVLKHHLPNTAVFDEVRQFSQGPLCGPVRIGPVCMGFPICEDAWYEDVCETLSESGANILLVPNGSPYHRNKHDQRVQIMVSRVVETGLPLIYLNMVGGQDDQLFDGGSFVLNPHGHLAAQLPLFENRLEFIDFAEGRDGWSAQAGQKSSVPDDWEQDYRAIVEGVRDYMAKSGFSRVLLGLSGGVDSALVATVAVDAIGAGNVRCILLPSRFTSAESREDAHAVASRFGCKLHVVSISELSGKVGEVLEPLFKGMPPDITEENIQSRMRGLLLMAISNKFGELLLTTGNKSEAAVGYATIYGDMAGGFNPIKDLYKTRVFETCRWRNRNYRPWMKGPKGRAVPERVIEKPPTAELRDNQRDSDSLPPYKILDQILEMLIDRDMSVAEVVANGFDFGTVNKVEKLIYASEYKRFQSAPGPRLTGRALWLDRRYPIVNHWRDSALRDQD